MYIPTIINTNTAALQNRDVRVVTSYWCDGIRNGLFVYRSDDTLIWNSGGMISARGKPKNSQKLFQCHIIHLTTVTLICFLHVAHNPIECFINDNIFHNMILFYGEELLSLRQILSNRTTSCRPYTVAC